MAAAALALCAAWLPVGVVEACTCAGLGGPVEVATAAMRDADVAFTGTVVDARPAAIGPKELGPMVAYAFDVDRATDEVDATLEVQALDDEGGAACGFAFGIGEEWFVSASQVNGVLQTNLCSGNMRLDQLEAGDVEQLTAMLPEQPAAGAGNASAGWAPPWPLILGLVGLVGAVGVTVFAFREPDRR